MAAVNPPLALQAAGSNHPSRLLRRAYLGMLGQEGVAQTNGIADLQVVENSPLGKSIRVTKGGGYVKGDILADNGLYFVFNDGFTVLNIADNSSGSTRIDVIIARINDNTDEAVAGNTWTLEVVQGTPGAGVPAIPSSALKLAEVSVASGFTQVVNANITDKRPFVMGAMSPLTYVPGTLYDGQLLSRPDLDAVQLAVGSSAYTLGIYKIAETILGADTASITFSSIPQNYRHLMVDCVVSGTLAANYGFRFNGDTTGNYDFQILLAGSTSISASEGIGASILEAGVMRLTHAQAMQATIHDYARTAWGKAVTSIVMDKVAPSTGGILTRVHTGAWRSTAAITSLTILPTGGNFKAGSIFILYGLP